MPDSATEGGDSEVVTVNESPVKVSEVAHARTRPLAENSRFAETKRSRNDGLVSVQRKISVCIWLDGNYGAF